ncbi:hypothetical protein [Streptomyces sp. NPDC047706]|uniref:hypothetical protein n=1 Tax=Streptomyces sp. NPDC047706 TaxID=3365486 RepID=UPI00372208AF
MPAKRSTAQKRAAARRRKPAARKHPASRVKIPRSGPIHARLGAWMALRVVARFADHQDVLRSRKDAAILRATHQGCPKCGGNGQIFTKGKDGSFTGSKPCPAPPTKTTVSRWEINRAARMGADKNTGLIGWSCPCGKKERPRYRDAKEATKALRTHERQKHGGKTVGGTWYAQTAQAAVPAQKKTQPAVSKVVTNSGKTDDAWIKQNSPMSPNKATAKGLCWQCAGHGKLYSAFGGQQLIVVCGECQGSGKDKAAA